MHTHLPFKETGGSLNDHCIQAKNNILFNLIQIIQNRNSSASASKPRIMGNKWFSQGKCSNLAQTKLRQKRNNYIIHNSSNYFQNIVIIVVLLYLIRCENCVVAETVWSSWSPVTVRTLRTVKTISSTGQIYTHDNSSFEQINLHDFSKSSNSSGE